MNEKLIKSFKLMKKLEKWIKKLIKCIKKLRKWMINW